MEPSDKLIMMKHEVDDLRKDISNNFSYMKEKLELILEQTTKHNGRMTKIESERLPKLEIWQTEVNAISRITKYILGFIATYIFVATGVLFNMWADWRNQKTTIQDIVRTELRSVVLEEAK
jgi:hypothetical protein